MRAHLYVLVPLLLVACAHEPATVASGPVFRPVNGFPAEVNDRLEDFFHRTAKVPGRKVAVFDGDGTVVGQVPHYLADECLYAHAKAHPDRRPELIAAMSKKSNVSIPYVQDRVRYLAGLTLEEVRALGVECFDKDYPGKTYAPMRELIALLKDFGFETWIITASPEALYQGFLSRELGVPITNVVGVKSIIRGGVVTDELVQPIPQDKGKMEAIETFVQAKPLLAGGNSRGDREMIEFSSDLHLIVNPDEHVEAGETRSVADHAKANGWLVVRIRDVPREGFPAVSSKDYGVRLNKTNDVPEAP